ncbi:Sirohydrochlorin ferrochelatase [Mariprofundus ferrinatatus]|uniref:Sirohydrochlorin ferrochelatase n=1 Tax=Mariprofundus ferrinatatus TaxID=1921087 RepID=A0A2K8L6C1_9PROT|nr:hypothetical protein [Mariprofundus ferrinatatus]ATX82837.1 Sirohydrochlorin ferrochelatase [Mariprofundus ferrinatatus]
MRVLLAHGSSDAMHASKVTELAAEVSGLLNDEVSASYLSDKKLPDGAEVLPLFLGAGIHVTKDAPQLAAAANCRLLPALGARTAAIAKLIDNNPVKNSIFLLYQRNGFENLFNAFETKGSIAFLHDEPSLSAVLQQMHTSRVTVQPLLLFPGRSLARVRRMINDSPIPDAGLAPVLCELNGFAELVADCFSHEA